MKKNPVFLAVAVVSVMLSGFTSCKNKKIKENASMYDLVIHGYDWGPAVDKIILHLPKAVDDKNLDEKDFQVKTTTKGFNWNVMPPSIQNVTGFRKIIRSFTCDENGTDIPGKSNLVCLQMEVHPDDYFGNPFLYDSDMMNHWQALYEVQITNEKLKIDISRQNKKICPEADKFTIASSTTDNITLHYAFWNPEASDKKIPLIIWLHGMGEGGTDPYIALLGNKVVNLISDQIQQHFENGAAVLVPQADGFWMQANTPEDKTVWITDEKSNGDSVYTTALFNLIDNFVKENPQIDKNRIYIGGCSNGGYMTINMLLHYPDYFAGAYPICQAYPDSKITEDKLQILKNQHIWFTQAKNDTTVPPVNFTAATFKRLSDSGAKDIHFTFWDRVTDQSGYYMKNDRPYEYLGHFSWIYTLNDECEENGILLFDWLSGLTK